MRQRVMVARNVMLWLVAILVSVPAYCQHLEVSSYLRKNKKKDLATIVFYSQEDSLSILSVSGDSISKRTDCNDNKIWSVKVDLQKERELGQLGLMNRRFILRTPYTADKEVTVPGTDRELCQASYYYKVRLVNYFPMSLFGECNINPSQHLGLRIGGGERLGGYLAFKIGYYDKRGVDADAAGLDVASLKYQGRIRKSYIAGMRYGLVSKDYPVYLLLGVGYGEAGSSYSNGEKGKKGQAYYHNYTRGFASELGVNFVVLDFLSLSCVGNVVFGRQRVHFDMELCVGFSVDITK